MHFQEEDENVKSLRTTDDARRTTHWRRTTDDGRKRTAIAHSKVKKEKGGGGGEITVISHLRVEYLTTKHCHQLINIHLYGNVPKLTFDLHRDGLHRYEPRSIIKIPKTIPQLDTPTWSYNFMYYHGIVQGMHTVRYVHTCTLYIVYIATFLKL